jgi:hypothetical protein
VVQILRSGQSRDQLGDPEWLFYDMNAFAEENTRFPLDVEMEFTGGDGI